MTQPAPAPTITLYDRTGQPHAIPHDDAPALIASGAMGLPRGSAVPVVKDGTVGHVPIEQAPAAFADGARIASPEELRKAELQAQYGGAGGQAVTGLLGGVSGATLGVSDEVASALGGREYIEQHKEANPKAWMAGQVAGAIAPALVGDESSLLGLGKLGAEGVEGANLLGRAAEGGGAAVKALTAPARATSAVGSAVEHAVSGLIGIPGEGSVISRLAKGVLAKGAGAATEGAVYGLANEVDEDVLGDHELNGEKLLAATGHGALLGLAAGAGLSAAGTLGSEVLGRASPTLQHMAEEQAVRSIDPRKAFVKELDKMPGGVRGAGRRLLDDGVIGPGQRLEDIAPKVTAAKAKAGEEIGSILDAADAAGFEGPSVQAITDRVRSEIMPDLEKMARTNKGALGKVDALLSDLHDFAGIPSEETALANGVDRGLVLQGSRLKFRQLQDFRARLDDQIRWNTSPLGPINEGVEAMKSFRGILESELEQSGEKAAKKMGGSFLDEYKAAKLAYRQYTVLDKAATDAMAAHTANRVVSPSDYMTGFAAEHLASGPIGAATGLLGAVGNHLLRTRGNSTAAVLLDKLSALRGVERATQGVDRQVNRAVAGLLREETHAAPEVAELTRPYRDHTEAVQRAASAPDQHAGAIAQAVAPLGVHAPKVAAAFQSAAVRATQYLSTQVPKRRSPPTLTPQLDEPRESAAQRAKYMQVAQAVHDPVSVLADMGKGTATRAQVQAFQASFPKLAAEVKKKVAAKLATRTKPLDYESRKQLALLYGPAAGPMFDPKFMLRMQEDFASPPGPPAGPKGTPHGGGGAPKRKLDGGADRLKLAGS